MTWRSKYIDTPPSAEDVTIDPTQVDCLDTAENVEEAFQEICDVIQDSASPGFSWSRKNNVTAGTWLQNGDVTSNQAGRTIGLTNAKIRKIQMANAVANTFDLKIYEHDGTTYTLLTTVTFTAVRSQTQDLDIAVTTGKELAIELSTGSANNIVVDLLLSGTYA